LILQFQLKDGAPEEDFREEEMRREEKRKLWI
jgi:hypothetical protein